MEEKLNEMLEDGYKLVTMSITNSAKAILVLKKVLKKCLKFKWKWGILWKGKKQEHY